MRYLVKPHQISGGGEPYDETDYEDEDEDDEALGDGPADHEVVPAHVRPRLALDILLDHFAPWSRRAAFVPQPGWEEAGRLPPVSCFVSHLPCSQEDHQPILTGCCSDDNMMRQQHFQSTNKLNVELVATHE